MLKKLWSKLFDRRKTYSFSCVVSDFTSSAPVEVFISGTTKIGTITGEGTYAFEFKATATELAGLLRGPIPGMFNVLDGGFTVDAVRIYVPSN